MILIKENDKNEQIKRVLAVYQTIFGVTSLETRLSDIKEEADELVNFTDEINLREELGDLITSCFCLAAEKGWNLEELIKENLSKVMKRANEGHYDRTGEACQSNAKITETK